MRVLEKSLIILSAMALGLDLNRVTGAQFLLLVVFATLALFYLGGAYFLMHRRRAKSSSDSALLGPTLLTRITAIATGAGIAFVLVTVLLRWQHWGNNHWLLFISAGVLGWINLWAYGRRKSHPTYKQVLQRTLPFSLLALGLWFIGDAQLFRWQFHQHPPFVEAYEAYRADPENEAKRERLYLERQRTVLSPEAFEQYFGARADSLSRVEE